eukprot:CAMPEP_0181318126 /NCGR_PEP_ID=MMETSP1101-20121128/16839_1 /TAXON_ID=46948 /ORGANISM="Rhodomonas abbreviata, Strain Caron Lab Isolate" /LENGTH=124 /DNA_ID=CAMNT_0023425573 /DNA_START=76 /DNA_END=450 /DNA_ORIENTATION=-
MQSYGWGDPNSPPHSPRSHDSHDASPFHSPREHAERNPTCDPHRSHSDIQSVVGATLSLVVSDVSKSFRVSGKSKNQDDINGLVAELQSMSKSMDERITSCRGKVKDQLLVLTELREVLEKMPQ